MNQVRRWAGGVLLAGLLSASGVASATSMQLQATVLPAYANAVTSFWVTFDDTGDGILQFSEITGFSGVTVTPPGTLFSSITYIPTIAGFTATNCTSVGCVDYFWVFGPVTALEARWTYSFASTNVPEPGTLALLGIGLAGLGVSRRRRA